MYLQPQTWGAGGLGEVGPRGAVGVVVGPGPDEEEGPVTYVTLPVPVSSVISRAMQDMGKEEGREYINFNESLLARLGMSDSSYLFFNKKNM